MNIAAGRVRLCRFVFKEPLRVVGVKSTAARTFLNLFQGRAEQLSHFERDDFGEPVLFQQQQLGHGRHKFRALDKSSSTIFLGCVFGVLQTSLDFDIVERSEFLQLSPVAGLIDAIAIWLTKRVGENEQKCNALSSTRSRMIAELRLNNWRLWRAVHRRLATTIDLYSQSFRN